MQTTDALTASHENWGASAHPAVRRLAGAAGVSEQ